MKTYSPFVAGALSLLFSGIATTGTGSAQTPNAGSPPPPQISASLPSWAYLWDPNFQAPPADDVPQHVAGSTATYSWKQARDLFVAPDWHPDDHPPMPEIVSMGTKPNVRACGSCHRVQGTGGPESSMLAGLPAAYIMQQIADFKSGARTYSGPSRVSVTLMIGSAKAMTEADAQAAADYYSKLKLKKLIKVVESDTVPKTFVARLFYAKLPEGGTEPLGQRIVEFPDDLNKFELRDSQAQFSAYVPPGSIAKGEALAKTGGSGTTAPCATCHGPELKGVDPIPGIAGRSPTYILRQLYDFQHGKRNGDVADLMKPTVEKLTTDDMIALAAYVASLNP